MKNDPELQIDNGWPDQRLYPPRRRQTESGSSRSLRILLVIFLVLIFVGGILYFLGKRPTGGEMGPLQTKMTALEQKIAELEKQLTDLQGKISASGPDSALLQRVDALAQKVETLEKQKQPAVETKAKPFPPPKQAVSAEKQYHTVQKGETLFGISKKYGISVE